MRSDKGAVLIVTLWTLIILSMLATGMAFRLSLEARASLYFLDEERAEYIAKAGVFHALQRLSEDMDDFDSVFECGIRLKPNEKPEDIFKDIPAGNGSFSVGYEEGGENFFGISDEDRKININTAGENVLTALFMVAGGIHDPFEARSIAYNVMDWRDSDHAASHQRGAEEDYYQSLEHPYHCADHAFRSIEELLMVKDITPEIFKKLSPYVTLYGDPSVLKINFNTAPETVLRVIAVSVGLTESNADYLVKRIVEWRMGSDKKAGTEDDGVMTSADIGVLETRLQDLSVLMQGSLIPVFKNYFKSDSSYYRIESAARLENSAVRKKITAVVKKNSDKGWPKFLYYHRD